jgi:thymidine phosphorylase
MAVVRLGGGRAHPAQVIDPVVGFSDVKPLGAKVAAGDVIARVHAASVEAATKASSEYLAALTLSQEPVQLSPIVHKIID